MSDGSGELRGRKVLVTQASDYMGPAIAARLREEGAEVVAVPGRVAERSALAALVEACPEPDVVIANLAAGPSPHVVGEIEDAEWDELFDVMVRPLMWIVRAFAPGMIARGAGKIVAITSAAPLRGIPVTSAYCAARGAQNAFVRAAGLELARENVQLNAVAQNYVHNEDYYPDSLVETERFRKSLARNVPAGRLARPEESADLALFLASTRSDFIVGQVVPFAGGWTTTTG
jgi:2-keto-3-deoxy-L-fuconate dehydrogenase